MDIFFDSNKRFKAEPEEVFIEDDECAQETFTPSEDCFEYACSPSTSTFVSQAQSRDVPAILDGQFFEIVSVSETTCTALCKLCEPRRKTINGSLKATGNFYDHIKRMHLSYMAEAETKRGAKRKPRAKKFDPGTSFMMIDPHSLSGTMFSPQQEGCTQEQAFGAIFNFVCDTMQPPTIVDAESFRSMVKQLCKNNAFSPTSQQIQHAIGTTIYAIRNFTEARLREREYICLTADLWSQDNRTYIGITSHSIDPLRFERESFALGFGEVQIVCKAVVAKEINDVLSRYHIQKKVEEIVTDNLFPRIFDDFAEVGISSHFRNFSSRLKAVVTEDVSTKIPHITEEKFNNYSKVYESSQAKLTSFWNHLKTNPRASAFCQQASGKILSIPTVDWTSKFEAIKIISETDDLLKIFSQLQLPPLDKEELHFVREYARIMQPFATAFDILKDTGSFRGFVLPTILSIKCRLEAMSRVGIGEILRKLVLHGLNERFEMLDIMSEKGFPFLIATISHPAFKMSCLPAELQNNARELFLEACSTLSEKFSPKSTQNTKTDSFFSVLKSPKASVDCITNEALRYLTDDSEDLAMLHRYPCVRSMFLKYNTCLSSSAPVEQLFEPCQQAFSESKPRGVSDGLFEDYLLIKVSNGKLGYMR